MQFDLTESVIEEIIFSMENQDGEYLFDSENLCVVPLDALMLCEQEELYENENMYSLPSWSSSDGFNLMEKFAESLHNSIVQKELLQVLANGRGVFRNYKNVLKQYPQIEQRFHSFKNKEMRAVVYEWYNVLRESWGLEKLDQDFEEYDELTREDFEFCEYSHEKDGGCVLKEAEKIADEIKSEIKGEVAFAIAHFWLRKFEYEKPSAVFGIICRTLAQDFAGCILFSDCSSFAKGVVALTSVFVNQNYRGLGIARELFSRGISSLKEHGIHQIIIADSALPDFLEPLIERCGFEKTGSVYTAELD
ncbi:GNAT family N-acetyltransferase [Treponema sp.]|uniref:GNAT family N-acetyltransferase n=1 Tax=Treponema sp. TaxID=166 RepID=UPI0038908438